MIVIVTCGDVLLKFPGMIDLTLNVMTPTVADDKMLMLVQGSVQPLVKKT